MTSLYFERPRFIYHLVQAAVWPGQGKEHTYLPVTHSADGFIHCTAIPQTLVPIGTNFYRKVEGDFLCVVIDTQLLGSDVEVKWEPPMAVGDTKSAQASTGPLMPHLYGGPFTTGSAVEIMRVVRSADGAFVSIDGVKPTPCDAVIWDCDGTMIDSEPLWHIAEHEVFTSLGMHWTDGDGLSTTGLRIDAVVQHWADTRGWPDPTGPGRSPADVTARIVAEMANLIRTRGKPLPGLSQAIALCKANGVRLAVASSSPRVLIDAALVALGLSDTFEVIASGGDEVFGKPHPATYLTAAARLGVAPTRCLAIEDSINGVLSAKAARMKVVAVPMVDPSGRPLDRGFGIADIVLRSLEDFDTLAFHAACTRA